MIRAFIRWLYRRFAVNDEQYCQCDHLRCMHAKGKGPCHEANEHSKELGKGCRCQKFIPDNGGGRGKPLPVPTPEDWGRIYESLSGRK